MPNDTQTTQIAQYCKDDFFCLIAKIVFEQGDVSDNKSETRIRIKQPLAPIRGISVFKVPGKIQNLTVEHVYESYQAEKSHLTRHIMTFAWGLGVCQNFQCICND